MKAKGTKFVSLFLVLSLLVLITPITAKEKRGVNIEIYKTKPEIEGTPWQKPDIKGELIAVKENSLLLLDSEGADITVNMSDIKFLIIDKKSITGKVFLSGFLVGGAIGALFGANWPEVENAKLAALTLGLAGGLALGGAGAFVAAIASKDKIIQIIGKSDSEIQEILKNLRKEARIPDYN